MDFAVNNYYDQDLLVIHLLLTDATHPACW